MPQTPKRRARLPACLTLGALLCALPALADPPAAPPAVAPTAQTILLQNTVPGDILKKLHWDSGTNLPPGVTKISALPATNSLSVVATPAGLARVQQIVKLLDIAPIPVQVKFALANATAADLDASGIRFDLVPSPGLEFAAKPGVNIVSRAAPPTFLQYATGKDVALFFQTLAKRGAIVQGPTITTSNNVAANLTRSTTLPSQVVLSDTFAVTPRVNSDDSVTLALDTSFQDGTHQQQIKTLRTVKSGDTMVLGMPPSPPNSGGKTRLLFVTPTIIGDPFQSAAPKK